MIIEINESTTRPRNYIVFVFDFDQSLLIVNYTHCSWDTLAFRRGFLYLLGHTQKLIMRISIRTYGTADSYMQISSDDMVSQFPHAVHIDEDAFTFTSVILSNALSSSK